jgi:hypothetical protein
MLPIEPIETKRGLLQEAFLVESRSLPGYSGSPVFISPMPFSSVRKEVPPAMFLGINMGHITDRRKVLSKAETQAQNKHVSVNDDWYVETNTGMSLVIPAWKVHEVLHVDELVESRNKVLKELANVKNRSTISNDFAESEEPSFTQADFEDMLKKTSRKTGSKK